MPMIALVTHLHPPSVMDSLRSTLVLSVMLNLKINLISEIDNVVWWVLPENDYHTGLTTGFEDAEGFEEFEEFQGFEEIEE